jgi:hypothetical protein
MVVNLVIQSSDGSDMSIIPKASMKIILKLNVPYTNGNTNSVGGILISDSSANDYTVFLTKNPNIDYNNFKLGDWLFSIRFDKVIDVDLEIQTKLKRLSKKIFLRLKVNAVLLNLYKKIKFKPGNSGYLESKINFESYLT